MYYKKINPKCNGAMVQWYVCFNSVQICFLAFSLPRDIKGFNMGFYGSSELGMSNS